MKNTVNCQLDISEKLLGIAEDLDGGFTITDEELHILTYAQHSLPLSSEGFFTFHNYCDTSQPFIMVISEGP